MVDAASPEPTGRVHQSDPGLVRACLAGDEAAWAELVDRYGRLVYSIPTRLGLAPADADDVFQHVFTTLFRQLPTLRDQTRLSAWLITTAQRESWRLGKLANRHAALDEAVVDNGDRPGDELAREEREQAVRQALRRIDERCSALLTALFLESATPAYDELARRLGMPIGSVGPTRARCFKKLEAILVDLGIDSLE